MRAVFVLSLCACGGAKPAPVSTPKPAVGESLDARCQRNDAEACAKLAGDAFEHHDTDRARELARKACELGAGHGCTVAGVIAMQSDVVAARQWFTRACDGHDADGCGDLGSMFLEGIGGAQDSERAIALLEPSCNDGF